MRCRCSVKVTLLKMGTARTGSDSKPRRGAEQGLRAFRVTPGGRPSGNGGRDVMPHSLSPPPPLQIGPNSASAVHAMPTMECQSHEVIFWPCPAAVGILHLLDWGRDGRATLTPPKSRPREGQDRPGSTQQVEVKLGGVPISVPVCSLRTSQVRVRHSQEDTGPASAPTTCPTICPDLGHCVVFLLHAVFDDADEWADVVEFCFLQDPWHRQGRPCHSRATHAPGRLGSARRECHSPSSVPTALSTGVRDSP